MRCTEAAKLLTPKPSYKPCLSITQIRRQVSRKVKLLAWGHTVSSSKSGSYDLRGFMNKLGIFVLREPPFIQPVRSVHSILNNKTTKNPLFKKKIGAIKMSRALSIPEALRILIFGSRTLPQSQILMGLDKFQRSQHICVKCICSRTIGNNSAEWLSGAQNSTHQSSLAYPLQRFMGPRRGGGLGGD